MDYVQDNNLLDENNLSEESKTQLYGIAQWGNILAILSFVGLVVGLVSLFVKKNEIAGMGGAMGDAAARMALGAGLFFYVIVIAITLLVYITLLNAAKNIKKGLAESDQGYFNIGVTKLATYFKIIGILAIIFGVIIFFFLLIGIFAGVASTFR
jgi:hypothetical protein